MRRADEGDFNGAASQLREIACRLEPYGDVPDMAEEIEDLQAEAARMEQRLYEASDRKYQAARAMANRDMKTAYRQQLSRRQRRKETPNK